MNRIREDEFGPTHCANCGSKFGERRILATILGVPICRDVVYADYEGSVLCELCMDDEVEQDANQ